MPFPVARIGSMTQQGDKIITGSSTMSTDFPSPPAISFSHNGKVIIYSEKDLGSENDDPESDDGLAIYPKPTGTPSAADLARNTALVGMVGDAKASSFPISNTVALPQDCSNIVGTVSYGFQLTPNFNLSDLTNKTALSGSQGHGDLVPQHDLSIPQIICNLKGVATNYLEPLAKQYGRHTMIITSGFRQGTSKSQHEMGMACDVQFEGISDDEYWNRAQWIAQNIAYDQMILEYLGSRPWIHCSFNRNGLRRQVLTAVTNGKYVPGLQKMR